MTDKNLQRLTESDAAFQDEIQQYIQSDSICDIAVELATAKALLAEMVRNAKTPVERQRIMPGARDCLKVVSALSSQYAEMQTRSGQILHRDVLEKFTSALCNIVCEEMELAHVPNYEKIIDKVLLRLDEAMPKGPLGKKK
jgi:hypothetical protein